MATKKLKAFMEIARILASLGTCKRRKVGCVLLDEDYKIIGSGYNGTGRGLSHCTDMPCKGAEFKSGEGLDLCEAIHAEQNALMQCHDIMKIKYCVTTTFPCAHCIKMLLNTSCDTIVFDEPYAGNSNSIWSKNIISICDL